MKPSSVHSLTPPTVTFLGAARSVSGSMHLLEVGPHRLLLDCGLFRGPRDEARAKNRHFPFDPASIDAVVLSHAHVDHCGNLPGLVKQGFKGPIYCTPATAELINVMMADSARIQEDDAHVSGVAGGRGGESSRKPLYTKMDAAQAVRQCVTAFYGRPLAINRDIQVRFIDAGHILGSSIVHLTLHHAGRDWSVVFTGDLGRRGLPFLHDPSVVPGADLIICESTYGGKTHDTVEGMAQKMSDVVRRTVARGGKVIIPAFSLGRTQIVLHYLRRWMSAGLLPRLPIFVDSPLAADISLIYDDHADSLLPQEPDTIDVEYVLTHEEAYHCSTQHDPCIIVASGGMCEGGRVVHHLRHHIDDPRSSVVLVSYQAPFSLGAQLLELKPTVRFMGRTWNKWIEVAKIDGFSGHADQVDFEALLGPAQGMTGKIRLVHGEVAQSDALAGRLCAMGFGDVKVPELEEVVSVG